MPKMTTSAASTSCHTTSSSLLSKSSPKSPATSSATSSTAASHSTQVSSTIGMSTTGSSSSVVSSTLSSSSVSSSIPSSTIFQSSISASITLSSTSVSSSSTASSSPTSFASSAASSSAPSTAGAISSTATLSTCYPTPTNAVNGPDFNPTSSQWTFSSNTTLLPMRTPNYNGNFPGADINLSGAASSPPQYVSQIATLDTSAIYTLTYVFGSDDTGNTPSEICTITSSLGSVVLDTYTLPQGAFEDSGLTTTRKVDDVVPVSGNEKLEVSLRCTGAAGFVDVYLYEVDLVTMTC